MGLFKVYRFIGFRVHGVWCFGSFGAFGTGLGLRAGFCGYFGLGLRVYDLGFRL